MKKKDYLFSVVAKSALFLYILFLMMPLVLALLTSVKPTEEFFTNPLGLPSRIALDNFYNAFIQAKVLKYGLNSVIVTVVSIIFVILINVLCSYGIHKIFRRKIGIVVYSIIILGLMVPVVGYVTTILLYRDFRLYDSLLGLIVGTIAGSVPFSTFILVGYLRSIPKELEEAAAIDGCTDLQSLRYIIVPTIKPAITTIAIFYMLNSWNNLFGPLLLIRNENLFTIPIGLLHFKGTNSIDYPLMFAAVIITSLPILFFFLIFQNNFIESLSGSVKG